MDLRQLTQFVAVAETLNFRAAAERLHMTQPPLSVSIRKLEAEIGADLFVRSTHQVRLTQAGEAVLDEARAALFHAEEVARVARATAAGSSGNLRVGFVGSAKNLLLPRLLPLFQGKHPGVVLKFVEQTNTRLIASLEQHQIDVAIVRVPLTRRSDVEYVTVEHDHFVVALPLRHRLAARDSIRFDELKDQPFIDYTAGQMPGLHALTAMLFEEAGVSPRVAQEAVEVQTVLFLVESGLGLALVPSNSARRAGPGVVFRPLSPAPTRPNIGLAIAYNPHFESVTVRQFVSAAIEQSPV
ncbi:LysR substrate-binding domain-containing protein [Rhodococcoides kyotonense]|uniref:DNA-binding transcriptional regulator, LysR family n=1 Tax=Rhodococcoides kyotonense TaxID=398843 RepID=A0A239MQE0_9NOCA|nr:LysR substrate-binding domain-containing protein [Rhodococcus kyotonensis]SNT44966.1 DNA-binding transcriptional regulator, LysR family [Rhodococcus kyotonensis]